MYTSADYGWGMGVVFIVCPFESFLSRLDECRLNLVRFVHTEVRRTNAILVWLRDSCKYSIQIRNRFLIIGQMLLCMGVKLGLLTLREERRLRMIENSVLMRIFVPKRVGGTGEWRELHNEELNNLYSSPNIVRMIRSRRMR